MQTNEQNSAFFINDYLRKRQFQLFCMYNNMLLRNNFPLITFRIQKNLLLVGKLCLCRKKSCLTNGLLYKPDETALYSFSKTGITYRSERTLASDHQNARKQRARRENNRTESHEAAGLAGLRYRNSCRRSRCRSRRRSRQRCDRRSGR